ncbi:Uncharacterised protein [Segatella copri]|nr:Uncharacterised protein [Segatella copri]
MVLPLVAPKSTAKKYFFCSIMNFVFKLLLFVHVCKGRPKKGYGTREIDFRALFFDYLVIFLKSDGFMPV